MNININDENGSMVVSLQGRLDTAAAAEVVNDFKTLQDNAEKEIILDCTGLDYISSSGLRLFISLRKVSSAKGGKVIIQHINDNVRNVFTMTGFYRLFTIKD